MTRDPRSAGITLWYQKQLSPSPGFSCLVAAHHFLTVFPCMHNASHPPLFCSVSRRSPMSASKHSSQESNQPLACLVAPQNVGTWKPKPGVSLYVCNSVANLFPRVLAALSVRVFMCLYSHKKYGLPISPSFSAVSSSKTPAARSFGARPGAAMLMHLRDSASPMNCSFCEGEPIFPIYPCPEDV